MCCSKPFDNYNYFLGDPGIEISDALREKKSVTRSHLTMEAGSPGISLMYEFSSFSNDRSSLMAL